MNTLSGVFFLYIVMKKPLKEYIFRPINGKWVEVKENAGLLCDFLAERSLLVDDRTQFARIYDHDEGILYYYRAGAGKVEITLWRLL